MKSHTETNSQTDNYSTYHNINGMIYLYHNKKSEICLMEL